MDQTVLDIHSTLPAGDDREWLAPGAALSRFEPPEGATLVAAEDTAPRVRYGFRVRNLGLLIAPATGSEVVPLVPIAGIPNSARWLLGMVNLRGNLVPVFDLARALALAAPEAHEAGPGAGGKPLILVLDKGDKAAGMLIDGFPQALAGLQRLAQLPALPARLERHVPAGYASDDAVWLELAHESFFHALSAAGDGE